MTDILHCKSSALISSFIPSPLPKFGQVIVRHFSKEWFFTVESPVDRRLPTKLDCFQRVSKLSVGLGPCETRNLRFSSKFSQNTVWWFRLSFRRVLGMLVTWRCLMVFLWFFVPLFRLQNVTNHHQSTFFTFKTLKKPDWNNLTEYWLNFEKNRRLLFGPSSNFMEHELW